MVLKIIITLLLLVFVTDTAAARKRHHHRHHHAKKEVKIPIPAGNPVASEPTFNDIWNDRILAKGK